VEPAADRQPTAVRTATFARRSDVTAAKKLLDN
jgi:hypothetical protein